jgi:predicted nucleic acid-binding protein
VISFDTNLLVYAADRDASHRHRAAGALIERAIHFGRCVQTLQSFAEFYNVATRKKGIAPALATEFVTGWQRVVPVEPASMADLERAMRGVAEHGLSFWDALIWATVWRAGVHVLVSEDFQDGRAIEGVRIANPFVAANELVIEAAMRA